MPPLLPACPLEAPPGDFNDRSNFAADCLEVADGADSHGFPPILVCFHFAGLGSTAPSDLCGPGSGLRKSGIASITADVSPTGVDDVGGAILLLQLPARWPGSFACDAPAVAVLTTLVTAFFCLSLIDHLVCSIADLLSHPFDRPGRTVLYRWPIALALHNSWVWSQIDDVHGLDS